MSYRAPLPIRDGLNPSRARAQRRITAGDFLKHLIATQRHRNPRDDAAALQARFSAEEVVDAQGRPFQPSSILQPGDDIWFYRMPMPEPRVPFEIKEIFRDENLLVINKPPFLATTPRGQHITQTALVRLRKQYDLPDLVPAHRLDRLTSGLLVFIIRPQVRGAYQQLFEQRRVHKTYCATAVYRPELKGARWRCRIEKRVGDLKAHIVPGEINTDTWVSAISPLDSQTQSRLQYLYGVKEPLADYELQPRTGKTHQLRLHMATAGVPILGEPLYQASRATVKHKTSSVNPAQHLPALGQSKETISFTDDYARPLRLTSHRIEFEDPITHIYRRFVLEENLN